MSGTLISWFGTNLLKSTCLRYRYCLQPNQQRLLNRRARTLPAKKKTRVAKADTKSKNFDSLPVEYTEVVEASPRYLIGPFLFSVGFTGACLVGTSIWQYENMRKFSYQSHIQQWFENRLPKKAGSLRNQIYTLYQSFNDGQKVVCGIIGLNALVFACWRVKSLQPIMLRWFITSPYTKPVCTPMLLSTFSHIHAFHLFINMYVLWSFSSFAGCCLGKEQFLLMYLAGGVWSSFISHAYKVAIKRTVVSLGASGAIAGVLGAVCLKYPDIQLSIVFLPMFTFGAGIALKGILGLELTGMLMRWKIIDHAGHLGGLLFGMYYVSYGYQHLWANREQIMKYWHNYREASSSGSKT